MKRSSHEKPDNGESKRLISDFFGRSNIGPRPDHAVPSAGNMVPDPEPTLAPHPQDSPTIIAPSTSATKPAAEQTANDPTPNIEQPVAISVDLGGDVLALDTPYQPNPNTISSKAKKSQNVNFQEKWYSQYPWLHYDDSLNGVLCFLCAKAERMGFLSLATKREPAFTRDGFSNWNKATRRFQSHQMSASHQHADSQLKQQQRSIPVTSQLDKAAKLQQEQSKRCMKVVFTTVRFLLRQGFAFRGHTADEGNLKQLLSLRSEDLPDLKAYLNRPTNYVSPQGQSEIMELYSHTILRRIAADIRQNGMDRMNRMNGTQDITGTEQESICIRYVDDELEVFESFVGLYEMTSTTGESIANTIADVLKRLNLSTCQLRAHTYDGAANMSGVYKGCQAKIKEMQPLALHFHCAAHLENLVIQYAVVNCPLIRDAIQWVHELGVLFGSSGKSRTIFKDIAATSSAGESAPNLSPIKPLCPTRWLCRFAAIQAVIVNYEAVLDTLHELSSSASGEMATKANGLCVRLEKAETIFALMAAVKPLASLEQLNKGLQSRTATVTGMIAAVEVTRQQFALWRSEESFNVVVAEATQMANACGVQPLEVPRRRRVPRRIAGTSDQFSANTAEEHFRQIYFQFFDMLMVQLNERFDIAKAGLSTYRAMEEMIISGQVNATAGQYPELDVNLLRMQLEMFHLNTAATSVYGAQVACRKMTVEVRAMFPQVFRLMKLLLVCPVSSCEAERSFSALRRLKTWLRSTMIQKRLNYVAVGHVHRELLNDVDEDALLDAFICRSDTRRKIFG